MIRQWNCDIFYLIQFLSYNKPASEIHRKVFLIIIALKLFCGPKGARAHTHIHIHTIFHMSLEHSLCNRTLWVCLGPEQWSHKKCERNKKSHKECFRLHIDFPTHTHTHYFHTNTDGKSKRNNKKAPLQIQHMPLLLLHFAFAWNFDSSSAPRTPSPHTWTGVYKC